MSRRRRAAERIVRFAVGQPGTVLLALAGAVSMLVILVQAPTVVHQLYRDADTVSAFVVPQLAGHGPPGTIIDLGNHPWYEAWWFERATIGLPGHFFIWEAAPYVVYFAGLAVVGLAAWIALGGWEALLTTVTLLVVGSGMRQVVFEPGARVGLIVHTGVLCLGLLVAWRRAQAGRAGLPWLLGWGAALAAFTAAGATDTLLTIDGVVPFLGAAWLWWWLNGGRAARTVALFAAGVAAVALLGGSLLSTLMIHDGVSASLGLTSFQFVQAPSWASDVANTATAWVSLADGNFFGLPVNKADTLTFALGALALAGLAAATLMALRSFRAWWADRAVAPLAPEGGSRTLFIAYWALVLVLTFASFSLTSIATNANDRYLIAAWVACASLLGAVATTRHGRAVLVAGVLALTIIIARDNIAFGVPTPAAAYPTSVVGQIERFVKRHGATTGFADYYYSHSLTWETGFRIKAYPLWACPGRPGQLCKRALGSDSAWFIPRRGIHTFLITGPQPLAIPSAPGSFGHPIATATFGHFTVAVYGHDVATNILQY
jgi:hypothetical protein